MRLNVLTTLLILSSLTLCAQNNLGRAGQQLNSLRGKISGVSITNTAHTSGAASSINVRGMSSLILSNQPLIIVDGVEFNSSVSNMSGDYWDGISSTSSVVVAFSEFASCSASIWAIISSRLSSGTITA